eukprot:116221_1
MSFSAEDILHSVVFWWILSAICLIISAVSFIQSRKYPNANKTFMLLSYGGLISSTLLCLLMAIFNTKQTFSSKKPSKLQTYFVIILSETLYGIELTFIYLVFLYRFKITFQGTSYQSSQTVHNIFCAIIGIFLLNRVGLWIFIAIRDFTDNISNQQNETFIVSYYCIEYIIDLIISIALILLFVNKLFKVAIDIKSKSESDNTALNIEQKLLIDVITKYTVISVIGVTFTQIQMLYITSVNVIYFYILGLYNSDENHNQYIDGYTTLYKISDIVWGLDSVVNACCIFLNFDFSQRLYDKLCCGCHSCFKLWTTTIIKKRIKNKLFLELPQIQKNIQTETE